MNLSTNEQNVLSYLKQWPNDFISPTQIGRVVGGKVRGIYRHSSWASPICKRLVKKGLVMRSEQGWYKAILPNNQIDNSQSDKKCNNPQCHRLTPQNVDYCCRPCRMAHEGGYSNTGLHSGGCLPNSTSEQSTLSPQDK